MTLEFSSLPPRLRTWIEEMAALCRPEKVHLCDGTEEEFLEMAGTLVRSGIFVPLHPAKRPGSFWCASDPDDVARVEESTFICSPEKEDAGPTNNWADPLEMKKKLLPLFNGSMQGRTLYIIVYCMGPLSSPYSIFGVEATDSPYVVLNMHRMTRMGKQVIEKLGEKKFVPGLHSVGKPLAPGEKDLSWPCNPEKRTIAHFPQEKLIWSYGSGYGGNALLGKKCLALRIASVMAKEEGWLAEHMLILGITNPQGEKKYIAAAFPSACGKTNLAMITPTLPGWKVETVGDDIAWMHVGKDGRLYAINPEAGYFGVAPGTSWKSNPHAMETIAKNTLFTNVALTHEQDVWWEGMTEKAPLPLTTWRKEVWETDVPEGKKAAHPNSRFTVSARQNPIYDQEAENPEGVPISAILFGGRRSDTFPLVFEALDFAHGVFIGASLSSETTAAAKGEVGKLRHDPFAMLPFCGYHMGEYFSHWLEVGKKLTRPPKIYSVNWFRKDSQGNYLWPGFGENSRILEWIFSRTEEDQNGKMTPIGIIPESLHLEGLSVDLDALFAVHAKEWLRECDGLEEYFSRFNPRFPPALSKQLEELRSRFSLQK